MTRLVLTRLDAGEWIERARVVASTALLCMVCWAASYALFLMVAR